MRVRRDVRAKQAAPGDGALRPAQPLEPLVQGRVPGGLGAGGVPDLYTPPVVAVCIPGEWAAKANSYGVRSGGRGLFRRPVVTEWERAIRAVMAEHAPLEGPLAGCAVVRSTTRRKDLHNVEKALLDACESRRKVKGQRAKVETGQGLYHDDRQVQTFTAWPLPPGEPCTWLALWDFTVPTVAVLSHYARWITLLQESLDARPP